MPDKISMTRVQNCRLQHHKAAALGTSALGLPSYISKRDDTLHTHALHSNTPYVDLSLYNYMFSYLQNLPYLFLESKKP
jgi:hypothetical protein